MQRAGHQLFACASLAQQKHGGIAGSDPGHLCHHLFQGAAATDDFSEAELRVDGFFQIKFFLGQLLFGQPKFFRNSLQFGHILPQCLLGFPAGFF